MVHLLEISLYINLIILCLSTWYVKICFISFFMWFNDYRDYNTLIFFTGGFKHGQEKSE
jgi:hypothetical protein